jgi:type I restriction enzyme S subunit
MYERVGDTDWKSLPVHELAVWKNGLVFKNIDFSDFGRPVIKIAELKNGVTEQTARTMAEYDPSVFVQAGDMLFSWSGNPDTSIEVFRWEGEDGWLNQHIFKVTPKAGISEEFLFFALRWLRPRFAEIARNKQTTGLGHVTIQDLRRMMVGVPDLDEQNAIVGIVGPLQKKIELNRRMNETLEAMARAIFKDWFVDFGPTRAKMEGRAPYLASDIWSLFPERIDADGLPEGWTRGELQDVIELNPSEGIKRGATAPYLDMAALPTSGPISDPAISREFTSGTRFRNGDTLLARITPCLENGKTAFVQSLPTNTVGWGSTEFVVLRSRSPVPPAYSYLLARDPSFRAHAIQSMTGTSGRQRARTEALATYPVARPSNEAIWSAFGSVIEPLFDRIRLNGEEARTLAQTRDLLLPKLMSGEIRIGDADKTVEAAA